MAEGLTLIERLQLRAWEVRGWFRRCPDCNRRGWDPVSPRWDQDPTALAFGWVGNGRCGACGRETTGADA